MEGRLHFQLASDQCGFKNVGKASVPRKSNVLLQREKVKMCVWVIPDAVHSAASDLLGLGFAFSSYFLSVVISYLHNLVFAFLQLPVPVAVAINGPTSSDAFRMGPSLWTLFAAHAQLQPSTPRLVWNGLLSSLAFGLRWLTAFVSWVCHAGNPCYLPGTLWDVQHWQDKVADGTIFFHHSMFVLCFGCSRALSRCPLQYCLVNY